MKFWREKNETRKQKSDKNITSESFSDFEEYFMPI